MRRVGDCQMQPSLNKSVHHQRSVVASKQLLRMPFLSRATCFVLLLLTLAPVIAVGHNKNETLPKAEDIDVENIAELNSDEKLPVELAPDQNINDSRRGNPSMSDLSRSDIAPEADFIDSNTSVTNTRQGTATSEREGSFELGELDESECSASQPIVMGNITWTGDTKQTMEGLGGSIVFYTAWSTQHPNKEAIYDAVFSELQPTILRLRNSWDSPSIWESVDQIMAVDSELVAEANRRLPNRKPNILLTSWSPPAFLKQNGILGGAGNSALIKDNMTDQFVYEKLADFWVSGLAAYKEVGIEPKYIAMNEPDYTNVWDTSRLDRSESYNSPGLYKAIDVIYDAMRTNMTVPPTILGPETAVWDSNYLDHPYMGSPRVHAASGHLYSAGVYMDSPNFFPRLAALLDNVHEKTKKHAIEQVYMTEFSSLKLPTREDPILLARTIYETLTRVDCGMYLHWDLYWGNSLGSTEGSLIQVESPWDQANWRFKDGWRKTVNFDWFRHFTRFILPGATRVTCEPSASIENAVRALCFQGPRGEISVILINFASKTALVQIDGLPYPAPGSGGFETFYTTLDVGFTNSTGSSLDDYVFLRPRSITTLYAAVP